MKKNKNVFLVLGLAAILVSFPVDARGANFGSLFKSVSKMVAKLTRTAARSGSKATRWAEKEVPKGMSYTIASPRGAYAMGKQLQQTIAPCPTCYGNGRILNANGRSCICSRCGGKGRIFKQNTRQAIRKKR